MDNQDVVDHSSSPRSEESVGGKDLGSKSPSVERKLSEGLEEVNKIKSSDSVDGDDGLKDDDDVPKHSDHGASETGRERSESGASSIGAGQRSGNISARPLGLGNQASQPANSQYFKTKLCPHFKAGTCTRGATCQFAHGAHELRDTGKLRKTKLCVNFQNGQCNRGDDCNFAHSSSELRELPDLRKTKICVNFQNGTCQMGDTCAFAHGKDELRSPPDLFKTALCHAFQAGRCDKGANCRYAHGDSELRPSPIGGPIKNSRNRGRNHHKPYPTDQQYQGGMAGYPFQPNMGMGRPYYMEMIDSNQPAAAATHYPGAADPYMMYQGGYYPPEMYGGDPYGYYGEMYPQGGSGNHYEKR